MENNTALLFDTAEHYSLQEASDYLNRKHRTDNITPKKLLKQISTREINTFVHFRMDNLDDHDKLRLQFDSYESNVFDKNDNNTDYTDRNSFLKHGVDIYERINSIISNSIIDDLYMGFILFRVDDYSLSNMALSNTLKHETEALLFDGFIYKDCLDDNPRKPSQLRKWSARVNNIEYYTEGITNIHFAIDSDDENILTDFKNKMRLPCNFNKIKNNLTFPELIITIDDLIILHKDLETLETQILENAPVPTKKTMEHSKLKSRRGVSPRRIEAYLIANTHAQNLWANDHDKKIRIGEMCEYIYNYIVDTEYEDQLPNNKKSLKSWLNDIPTYASGKGRPEGS